MDYYPKACCEIIKPEIMQVVNNFQNLHVANLHWINSANIALILKKGDEDVLDFRPISLIHAIGKYIAMMGSRLAPHMTDIVSNAQSAFIKREAFMMKEHGAPCVVLVIDDNLYGLMVALSYICRTCP
jgi:hypothetical protein